MNTTVSRRTAAAPNTLYAYGALPKDQTVSPMRTWSAALLGGACLGVSLMASQPARALNFTFSFSNKAGTQSVSGIIEDLADNKDGQIPNTIRVTSSTIASLVGIYTLDSPPAPLGFNVSDGKIVFAEWFGLGPTPDIPTLAFGQFPGINGVQNGAQIFVSVDCSGPTGNPEGFCPVDFAPVAPANVPGPLPVLGAAAAFGYSRKLRNRIKGSGVPGASAID